jgi:hypothetical protein
VATVIARFLDDDAGRATVGHHVTQRERQHERSEGEAHDPQVKHG